MKKTLFLQTPKNFAYRRTVWSHGWYQLLPFEFVEETWTLGAVVDCGRPIFVEINEAENGLQILMDERIDVPQEAKILQAVRHIFRLDDDLSNFYKLTKNEKHLAWVARQNAGRMLRSATVFEDLVKTICTTNCNWAMTKIMVTNLVNKLGEVSADGKKAFPTPQAMAKMPVEFYQQEIRAGYRAAYFKELAEKIAEGKLNVESWLDTDLPTKQLKKEIKQVKGVGNYAAENLLKLLGRYDGLALDSFLRGEFYKKYNQGNICDDKQIESAYEKYGDWRGLVMWLDMTEKWL
jgi:3-methyladenine DNA glycosylase/8-oxoguanine DNA glycosylase